MTDKIDVYQLALQQLKIISWVKGGMEKANMEVEVVTVGEPFMEDGKLKCKVFGKLKNGKEIIGIAEVGVNETQS